MLCRYPIVNEHFGVVADCDHKHKAFCLSYLSLLQSQDSLPHNMAWIIYVSLYIYIRSIWHQMVVEHHRRSIWRRPLRAQTEFVRKNGSSWRSLGRKWEDIILPGRERARLKMHREAMIEQVWRWTLRPWSSEVGDAIGDRDWLNSEMHWEAIIERDWRSTWKWSIWREAWRQLRLWLGAGNWLGAGDCRCWDDAVLDVCCTRC